MSDVRYFFDNDGDGHWFMIPTNLKQWWSDLLEDSMDNDDIKAEQAMEQIDEVFGEFMIGGDVSDITFTNPRTQE